MVISRCRVVSLRRSVHLSLPPSGGFAEVSRTLWTVNGKLFTYKGPGFVSAINSCTCYLSTLLIRQLNPSSSLSLFLYHPSPSVFLLLLGFGLDCAAFTMYRTMRRKQKSVVPPSPAAQLVARVKIKALNSLALRSVYMQCSIASVFFYYPQLHFKLVGITVVLTASVADNQWAASPRL